MVVSITGAGGQIGSVLSFLAADGRLLGPGYRVFLKLIEVEACVPALEGLIDEIEDLGSMFYAGALATADPAVGFKDADVILLVGAKPRLPGMERKDLLVDNANIFASQGKVINEVAKTTAKILVVGNPANTNAYILSKNAPNIPKENITSLTRLDYNRSAGLLSKTYNCSPTDIDNISIWGNHSASLCLDLSQVKVGGKHPENIEEKSKELEKIVQQRGAEILKKRGKSSCNSAAIAICDHIGDWVNGTGDRYVSMGVFPVGNTYNIPEHLNFAVPVKCIDGKWEMKKDVKITEEVALRIKANIDELEGEKAIADTA